jgi:hypothetical protein
MSEPSKQSKGGTARAKRLTKDQRTEIARAASGARWGLAVATHEGELRIGDVELPCAVLEDGRRLFVESPLLNTLSLSQPEAQETRERLQPYIAIHLGALPEPAKFRTRRGGGLRGLRAELLPKFCEVWLDGRKHNVLTEQELPTAEAAETLIRSFSQRGVIAAVDEATGFLFEWLRGALIKQLAPLVHEGLAFCVQDFPSDFFKEMCRLRGVAFKADMQLPEDFGDLTVDIVFSRMQPEALAELKETLVRGGTKKQSTPGLGHAALLQHLGLLLGLMRISADWEAFRKHLNAIAPPVSSREVLNQ